MGAGDVFEIGEDILREYENNQISLFENNTQFETLNVHTEKIAVY
ncbi:MAG: hypothetical protein QMB54_07635 [Neofamilia sp.]